MEDFNTINRTIISGIYSFEFIPVSDVESIPAFGADEIEFSDIVLASGKTWKNGEADFNSLTLSILPKYSGQGVQFTCELKGFLPDLKQSSSFNFINSVHVKYLIIAKTHQQDRILVGTIDDPLKLAFSANSEQLGGRKGYPFTFSGNQLQFPSFIAKVVAAVDVTFEINTDGQLEQTENTESFSINSDGQFVVAGPDENNYSINTDGDLIQA